MYICVYIYIYVCMYVHTCVYIYIYVYIVASVGWWAGACHFAHPYSTLYMHEANGGKNGCRYRSSA